VYSQSIRYPAVPINEASLRISVTAWLSHKNIESTLRVFDKVYEKFIK